MLWLTQVQAEVELSQFSLGAEPVTPLPDLVPIDPLKRALGQALFFDKRFSYNAEQSCGDCHKLPPITEDSSDASVLKGARGGEHKRDMTLLYNVANNYLFNWDGRYARLERLIEDSISDVNKFNSDWSSVLSKLSLAYRIQSQQAYGQDLDQVAVIDALTTFMRSLATPPAPFDRYLQGEGEAITDRQRQGFELFKRVGCSSCHNGRALGANFFIQVHIYRHDGGDEEDSQLKDLGRYYVTGEEADRNGFRTPSLRNVAQTAPYFHDGSVPTLEEAVEEMAEQQLGIVPSEEQITLIVEFLQSLSGQHAGITEGGVGG
tara:strand:- start:3734 stop:4690 length:957 start_codon:yes stop_codon:yes gene_type:complete